MCPIIATMAPILALFKLINC